MPPDATSMLGNEKTCRGVKEYNTLKSNKAAIQYLLELFKMSNCGLSSLSIKMLYAR
jgi:hypothetical protein